MTRTEHIAWAKRRALEYVNAGNLFEAYASFLSDLGKHVEADPTRVVRDLMMSLYMNGHLKTARQMREFIDGAN